MTWPKHSVAAKPSKRANEGLGMLLAERGAFHLPLLFFLQMSGPTCVCHRRQTDGDRPASKGNGRGPVLDGGETKADGDETNEASFFYFLPPAFFFCFDMWGQKG